MGDFFSELFISFFDGGPWDWCQMILFYGSMIFLIPLFLHPLRAKRRRWVLALFPAFMLAVYGATHFLYGNLTLIPAQIFIIYAWMLLYYKAPAKELLFLALIYYLCNRASRSFFQTPILYPFERGFIGFSHEEVINRFFFRGLFIPGCMGILIYAVRRAVDMNEIATQGHMRYAITGLLMLMYVNMYTTKIFYVSKEDVSLNLSFTLMFQCSALLGFIALSERYLIVQKREREQERIAAAANQQYESVRQRAEAEETVRRIYHDMKNHLILLQRENSGVKEYLRSIDAELAAYERSFNTGNDLLDSILREKARRAEELGVDLKAFVDFREGGFISPMDMSAIFGNALDNAIEAASAVEDRERRLISLKASSMSGLLTIKVVNCFDGEKHPLKPQADMLATTKPEPAEHGIGLRSIRYSVEKYGGAMQFSVEEEYYFVMKILLPIPPAQAC